MRRKEGGKADFWESLELEQAGLAGVRGLVTIAERGSKKVLKLPPKQFQSSHQKEQKPKANGNTWEGAEGGQDSAWMEKVRILQNLLLEENSLG